MYTMSEPSPVSRTQNLKPIRDRNFPHSLGIHKNLLHNEVHRKQWFFTPNTWTIFFSVWHSQEFATQRSPQEAMILHTEHFEQFSSAPRGRFCPVDKFEVTSSPQTCPLQVRSLFKFDGRAVWRGKLPKRSCPLGVDVPVRNPLVTAECADYQRCGRQTQIPSTYLISYILPILQVVLQTYWSLYSLIWDFFGILRQLQI
jgi:hypothetical protein